MTIRLLFVNVEGRMAGAEESLLLLLRGLVGRHEIHVACPDRGPLAQQCRDFGCIHHPIPSRQARSKGRLVATACWALHCAIVVRRIVWRVSPAILHANNYLALAISLPAVLGRECKLIWHARDIRCPKMLALAANMRVDAVIANSGFVRGRLVSAGISAGRIRVIHNAVKKNCHPMKTSQQTQGDVPSAGDAARFLFANVGQFVPWKNQMVFLEAVRLVFEAGCDAEYWLIGDDIFNHEPRYKKLLLERVGNLRSHGCPVRWTGWLSGESIWRQVDCLVHTAETEPFGRVIIEAMAAGVPVIAVNSGGPAEIIQDDETGVLVSHANPATLSGAMMHLRNDPGLRERLARQAKAEVEHRFTSEAVCQGVERLYDELLNGGLRSAPVEASLGAAKLNVH